MSSLKKSGERRTCWTEVSENPKYNNRHGTTTGGPRLVLLFGMELPVLSTMEYKERQFHVHTVKLSRCNGIYRCRMYKYIDIYESLPCISSVDGEWTLFYHITIITTNVGHRVRQVSSLVIVPPWVYVDIALHRLLLLPHRRHRWFGCCPSHYSSHPLQYYYIESL